MEKGKIQTAFWRVRRREKEKQPTWESELCKSLRKLSELGSGRPAGVWNKKVVVGEEGS